MIPANKEAIMMYNLALLIITVSVNANNVMNIDIVNPMPPKIPAPKICFQFKSEGSCAAFIFTDK